jgi:hypothetical protein
MVEYFVYTEKVKGSIPFMLKMSSRYISKIKCYQQFRKINYNILIRDPKINLCRRFLPIIFIINNLSFYPFEKTKQKNIATHTYKYILGFRKNILWVNIEKLPEIIAKIQRFFLAYCQDKSINHIIEIFFITEKTELKNYFYEIYNHAQTLSCRIFY